MKEKERLTLENGNDVTESINNGFAKAFFGIDHNTEKEANKHAKEHKTYSECLYQNGLQVGYVVLK